MSYFRIILKRFLADSGLFGLDLSPDAHQAKTNTLLMLYQPSTILSAQEYEDNSEIGGLIRKVYGKFLVQVSDLESRIYTHIINNF